MYDHAVYRTSRRNACRLTKHDRKAGRRLANADSGERSSPFSMKDGVGRTVDESDTEHCRDALGRRGMSSSEVPGSGGLSNAFRSRGRAMSRRAEEGCTSKVTGGTCSRSSPFGHGIVTWA